MKKLLLALCALAVLAAVGVQLYKSWVVGSPEPSIDRPLAEILTRDYAGWQVTDKELGDTESLREYSERLLNLDDFVYREYQRGDRQFGVYVAYWSPGKMPVRLVNSHTPDRCWTWNGWKCTDMRFAVDKDAQGGDLQPAEWRIFETRDTGFELHTYYWHIVGGQVHTYRQGFNEDPPMTVVFQDLWRYGLNQEREQFFVRITSPDPFDRVWDEPAFQSILEELRQLCLGEADTTALAAVN